MTVTENMEFQCPITEPQTSIILNPDHPHDEVNGTSDTADCSPGLLCINTGTTQANDMTPATVLYGETAQAGTLYAIEIEQYTPDFPTPNMHPPNTSFTHATYKKAVDRPLKLIKLDSKAIGLKLWLLGTINATAAATRGEIFVCAANGFIARVGDPDGATVESVAYGFKVLATVASQNWIPVEYIGKVAYDKTP
jgi:hypothetical protein